MIHDQSISPNINPSSFVSVTDCPPPLPPTKYDLYIYHHVNISTPLSVIKTICSNCALRFLLFVTIVHPSSQYSTPALLHSVNIGSMVKHVPGSNMKS